MRDTESCVLRHIVEDAVVQQYERDGVVCLRQTISTRWIDVLRIGVDRNLAESPHGPLFVDMAGDGTAFSDMFRWHTIREYEDAGCHSEAAEIAGQLMGADEVVFIEEQMFYKARNTKGRTPWHQDLPYYPLQGRMCVVWIPLTRHEQNESLELVRGSHRWGRQFVPRNFSALSGHRPYATDDALPDGVVPIEDIDRNSEKYDIVSWSVDPGDCIVFDALTLHGNRGSISKSGVKRVALRYGAEDVIYVPNKFPWVYTKWPFDELHEGERLVGPLFPVVWRRAP